MAIQHKTIEQLPAIKIKGSFGAPITGVSIDTRSLNAGDLFVAFIGTQVDGHDYIPKAISRGASAVMASTSWDGCEQWDAPIPLIMTEDPVKTLAELATEHRKTFNIPVIAITGTNGKTSTKNMLAHVLGNRFKVLKTLGNLNNHIGLPMTILGLNESHELAIIEMGASQKGDIAYLCDIAQPTQGLITNVGLAHTEFFKDIETIQSTKGELFQYLGKQEGRAYINMDDERVASAGSGCPNPIQYGFHGKYEYSFGLNGPDDQGCYTLLFNDHAVNLPHPGKAMALNAAATVSVSLQNGILYDQLKACLEDYPGEPGRMQLIPVDGVSFINDAYNANPASVQFGLESIASMACTGKKIVVFADMLELGAKSAEHHAQVGNLLIASGVDEVYLYGSEVEATKKILDQHSSVSFKHTTDKAELHRMLNQGIHAGDLVYLKGSRGMALETIIQSYKDQN